MDINTFSPYIRRAIFSTILSPFIIRERIIYDHELIYVMDGTCAITVDGKEYVVKKGDCVFFPPNVPHELRSISDTAFVQPHIHFDALYSEKSEQTPISFQSRDQMSEDELALIQENAFANCNIPYVFTPIHKETYVSLFFEIIDIFQEKKSGYTLLYKAKMLELFALLFEQFESKSIAPTRSVETSGYLSSIKNYLDGNYRQQISLERLAMQFYVNKYTLLRQFKKAYGIGIIAYYHALRIDYAKRKLASTDLSITEIAKKLCFGDVYTFSRFFKNSTGMSPREYRALCGKVL
ncbi:MAG: helix-turn-helix domain-containing protein [Clostridia bacterium]|nr:helix-turn-helix domain-containing protein [Clostridia bacterium]